MPGSRQQVDLAGSFPVSVQTLLPETVEAFVREARVGRLATVDEAGRPHVVPVCFVYEAGILYSALDEKPKHVPPARLRRVRNLLANPRVQVLVDEYGEDWTALAYVQLRGRATLLPPGAEHSVATEALRRKYPQYRSMAIDERPLIRVEVTDAAWWGRRFPA